MAVMAVIARALNSVGSWTLANPMAVISVVLAISIGMVFVSKSATISALRESIENPRTGYKAQNTFLTIELAVAKRNYAALDKALKTQTAGITALNQRADQADSHGKAMMAALAVRNADNARRGSIIAAAQPGADKCNSAFNLIRSSVQ